MTQHECAASGIALGPNWDARQLSLCMAGAAGYAVGAAVLEPLVWPLSTVAAILFCAGLMSVRGAVRQLQFENTLSQGKRPWFNFEELYKLTRKDGKMTWLGFGFPWEVSQCQSVQNLLKTNWREAYGKSIATACARRYLTSHLAEALSHPLQTISKLALIRRAATTTPGYRWIHALGQEDSQYLSAHDLEGHMIVFGTTGAGKSRFLECMVAQAIFQGKTVIVVDPKGDKGLERSMRTACTKAGRGGDFLFFHLGHPEASINLNLLANYSRISEVASRIVDTLPGQGGEGQVFVDVGRGALRTICDGLEILGKKPSFANLYHWFVNRQELVLEALKRFLSTVYSEDMVSEKLRAEKTSQGKLSRLIELYRAGGLQVTAIDGLIGFAEQDDGTLTKMTVSTQTLLSSLTRGDIGRKLSPATEPGETELFYDTKKIISRHGVLYMGLDAMKDSGLARAIGSMFLADLAATAGARYDYETSATPVSLFVDEAAELTCEPFTQMLNKSRGAGFSICMAAQTKSDFVAKAKDPAEASRMLANANSCVALRCNDVETQEFVTNRISKARIKTRVQSHGVSTSAEQLTAVGGSVSERISEEEVDLVPATLLGALPNCEFFAVLAGGHVVKGRVPILLESGSQYKEKMS